MIHYDSISAIEEGSRSLQMFNDLVADRHHASYCRRERLQEWLLRGTWLMSSLGNTGRLVLQNATLTDIPEIAPWKTIKSKFPNLHYYVDKPFYGIPPAGAICANCRKPWDITNAHLSEPQQLSKETHWVANPDLVGKRYDEIPRATIEADGITVCLKPTTLIIRTPTVRTPVGRVICVENYLTYDYELEPGDELACGLWKFVHTEKCPE